MRPPAPHHFFGLGHHLATAGPIVVWAVVLAFVFVECAFIIGLFLPGDSLLFTAGVVLAGHNSVANAWALAGAAVGVAVAGNMVGYWIGRRTGTSMVGRPGAKVLTAQRLAHAHAFLDRHGSWSIVLARWIPWIRTLAPLVAGAARMNPKRFALSTTIGAAAWVPVLVIAGYYGAGLIHDLPWIKATVTALGIVFFVVGTGLGIWRYRKEINRTSPQSRVAEVTADN
jgi:membrane-associated protein